jgi:hypothetical protein
MLLIIIFFLLNFNKVSPHLITEPIFSQPFLSNIVNEFNNAYSNAYTYSNAYAYSNNFIASTYSYNSAYSNAFNSNNYISYSFYTTSAYKSSNLYITVVNSNSYHQFKSIQSWSLLSTPTNQPTVLLTINPTQTPSQRPTFQPTFHIPTLEPTLLTIMPTILPTPLPSKQPTFLPTLLPSKQPTFLPTHQDVSLLKVETSMTLSGFTKKVLDENSLTAIILSIAQSANITSNYVSIKEYSFINARRRRLTFTLLSLYNLYLTSQITIPINSQNVNPSSLYTSLTNNIQTSINSGTFITYLLNNAATLNASISSNNMTVSNYTVSQMVIISGSPTFMPTSIYYGKSVPSLSAIYVVKLVFITMACFIVFLFIFGLVLKKVNNYNDYNNNIISHNEIQISV